MSRLISVGIAEIKGNLSLPVEEGFSELEQLYQTAPVGLCLLDPDLRFLRVNKRLAAIHGCPVESHQGRTVREVIPELADMLEPVLRQVLDTGSELLDVDIAGKQLADPNANAWWRASYHPVRDEDGKVLGISVVVQDVSDLRRKEHALDERARFERTIAEISSVFVNINAEQVDSSIEEALEKIGDCLGTDLGTLLLLDPDRQCYHVTHEWVGRAAPAAPSFKGIYVNQAFPWLSSRLEECESFFINSLEEWPEEAAIERERCELVGIKSVLWVPFEVSDRIQGYVSLNTLQQQRTWSDDFILRLQLVGEIFGNALLRKQSEQALQSAFDRITELKERLESENLYLRAEVETRHKHAEIIGESKAIRQMLMQAEQVAPTDSSVLLVGETGTGKELLAREVHKLSDRSERAMVTVNCGALPATLIEAELFGREKGAYTGALSRQIGRFELADQSTLFLDEIGELPADVQIRLLRFLQDGTFERLGSNQTIKVDVRVIAATNRDLAAEVRDGKFREDLYYRLNVFPVTVPPLRERSEDIPLLVWSFVKQFSKTMGKSIERIPVEEMESLQRYAWPGNIRELRNVIERAMILARGNALHIEKPESAIADQATHTTLEQVERAHIEKTLAQHNWRIGGKQGAAAVLGLKSTTLRSRMEKLGIPLRKDRRS